MKRFIIPMFIVAAGLLSTAAKAQVYVHARIPVPPLPRIYIPAPPVLTYPPAVGYYGGYGGRYGVYGGRYDRGYRERFRDERFDHRFEGRRFEGRERGHDYGRGREGRRRW
jgi:hypothetical protein